MRGTTGIPWTEQRRPYFDRRCPACGAAFVARIGYQVYCSPRCKSRVNARLHYWRHHQRTERAA